MRNPISRLLILFLAFSALNCLAIPTNIQLDWKIKQDKNTTVLISPPENHHFNLAAPNAISVLLNGESTKAEPQVSEKSVQFQIETRSACEIHAKLFICDNKNTYCVPVDQDKTCDGIDVINNKSEARALTEKFMSASRKKPENYLFIENDPEAAFNQARQGNKIILIDFFAIWCPGCNILDTQVFQNKKFIKEAKNFILLKMDGDKESSAKLKEKYQIVSYPTVVITRANGDEITRIIGERSLSVFLAEIKAAIKGKSSKQLLAKQNHKLKNKSLRELNELLTKAVWDKDHQQALAIQLKMLAIPEGKSLIRPPVLEMSISNSFNASSSEENLKILSEQIRQAINAYPHEPQTLKWFRRLTNISDKLKDNQLNEFAKHGTINLLEKLTQFTNEMLEASGTSRVDLFALQGEILDADGKHDIAKQKYLRAIEEIEREMKNMGVDFSSDRGYNLNRAWLMHKSGQSEKAI
ncbi:MAG TPA: thioredoxin family protein, partial [Pseudobdellovibrionaceae bacterium]|nr:thioredoxin family protein [Pseudobdellovibrionaceae bacterium]